jgi:glutamate 5-kinase
MTMREELAAARRVVVKVGSSSLTTADGGIDPHRIEQLVGVLARARLAGREIVLVSSGAIAAGLPPLGLKTRPRDLANQQAAASVGQGLLMGYYTQLFDGYGLRVGQVLLTADDVTRHSHYRNAFRSLAWCRLSMRTTQLRHMRSDSVTMIDSLRWWRIWSTPMR